MADSWFKARFSWSRAFDLLDDSELASIVRACWRYAEAGEELQVIGKAAVVWPLIVEELRQDRADRENGRKGGRPPNNPALKGGFIPHLAEKKKRKNKEQEGDKEAEEKKTKDSLGADSLLSNPDPKRKQPKKDSPGFDSFWSSYPKKQAKADALKAWNALAPDEALQAQIMEAIQVQRASPSWTKDGGQFIPLPATWLRGRRWEDEQQTAPEVCRFAGIDLGVTL